MNFYNVLVKNYFSGFLLICLVIVTSIVHADNDKNGDQTSNRSNAEADVALKSYRKLLKEKLKGINQALETIRKSDHEKQYKIIGIILEKILKFFSDAKVRLTELGVAPGDPFPTDENVREVYSLVIENTYFLGKMVLQMPDIVHDLMVSHPEWKMFVQFAIGFSNDSNAFHGIDDKLLHLMAQELNIIERSPEYVNPNSRKYAEEKQREMEKEVKETRKAKSKEKKKKQKGPKLSGPRRYEL